MMQLTSSDETDLLTALYEGAFDEPLWSTFLARLRARAQADWAAIMFRSGEGAGSETALLQSGRTSSEQVKQRYFAELYRLNPIPYGRLRPERVYALSEFLDLADPGHRRFYDEIVAPSGHDFGRIVRVQEPSGGEAWCMVNRQSGDFPASAGALLTALAPHLRIALRSFIATQRQRLRADISGEMVQRLNLGWLTLDGAGRLVAMDGQAERLLQRSPLLRRTGHGRLLTASAAADRAITEMLRAAKTGETIRPRLLHLSDEPWFDMLVLPVAADTGPAGERWVLTVYIQGDEHAGTERCEQLMTLFDLSAKEARLALALSRGRTMAEAAAELGLTLESARTYSKRVYAKTATRSQSDLVRLVLASVIALA